MASFPSKKDLGKHAKRLKESFNIPTLKEAQHRLAVDIYNVRNWQTLVGLAESSEPSNKNSNLIFWNPRDKDFTKIKVEIDIDNKDSGGPRSDEDVCDDISSALKEIECMICSEERTDAEIDVSDTCTFSFVLNAG